jgi:lipoyl(octanoyl) transferase
MEAMPGDRELWVRNLGRVPYAESVTLQESLRERVVAGELPDTMLLLEHPPTYTLGRRSEPGDLPFGEDWCRAQGIDVARVDRGGKLTYHGPGQLVGYPIVHVTDVIAYLRAIERAIVSALAEAGLEAHTREGKEYTGVWVQERKIASIGIHLSRGVATHGFAINVVNDLAPFTWAVPCGLPDVTMTSMAAEGAEADVACMRKRMGHAIARELGLRQRLVGETRVPASIPSMA